MKIVFENCEVFEVAKEDITYFNIWGVTESLNYSAYNKKTRISKCAKGFNAGIRFNSALIDRCSHHKDITHIEWDGVNYSVIWDDEDAYENNYQSSNVDEFGVFHIRVYQ